MKKNILRLGIVVLVLLIAGVLWLNNDINQKKEDEANKNAIAANADFSLLSDDDPNFEKSCLDVSKNPKKIMDVHKIYFNIS